VARLSREAEAAALAGRVNEAVALLKEAARLDPRDRRTLHRLGDIHRRRLNRPKEAADYYAKEARCEESEGFEARAIALWRLVLRCDPERLEAYERVGALYVALGRPADARHHYERSAAELRVAGLVQEAAIVRAHLAALAPAAASLVEESVAPPEGGVVGAPEEATPDDNAADLASDRLQNGRLFHHYGLHRQAREQLELLVASLPDHLEARQLLVEVCRATEDHEAAAQHLRVVTRLLVRRGQAETPAAARAVEWELPPVEEWALEDAPADPMADLLEEIREDVERVVVRLERKAGGP
jgi:tetratricopeptide (TPR) repeat protein